MGHIFTAQEVYHDQTQKNYEPYYDGSIFPPYASGAGYVLSMSLVQSLEFINFGAWTATAAK